MSNLGIDKYWTGQYKMKDLAQLKNPRSGRFVLIDTRHGGIRAHKVSKGPYKNIRIVVSKTEGLK